MNYDEARKIILESVKPVETEIVKLSDSAGRILAEDIIAVCNVPDFDRSPYDGYAFRAEDVPGTLHIIGEIRAGENFLTPLKPGEAVKILTGAMIPEGADAVVKYEDTEYTDTVVTVRETFRSGDNVIRAGEDIKKGDIVARAGEIIDAGTAGVLASQNISSPKVYRQPKIGIITTGSELQDLDSLLTAGKIRNTSRYTFESALTLAGFVPDFCGIAIDDERAIAGIISEALKGNDALIVTGGVSAGDYDRTPEALKIIGAEILVRDVALKPGGKCVYAVKNGKLICCLSGNPASALTNYYTLALPAFKKLSGLKNFLSEEINVTLANSFPKRSPQTRMIRGRLKFSDGQAVMFVPSEQGNGVLSTMSGSNFMAVIPSGSGKLPEGTRLKGFTI